MCSSPMTAIFGGSYGWGSAGRFHHPQSQLHRFLNCIGGYVSPIRTDASLGADRLALRCIPSGKIELFSAAVAGFGYQDCPGHAAWLDPEERLGAPRSARFPLHLIANQPRTRLHSQQDMGEHSQQSKIHRREPLCMHPDDAAARGIRDGDLARVSNDTGSLLAGVMVTDSLRPGVVQRSTGAWFDPSAPEVTTCVHGNPNVLTRDRGSSSLAQGCTGQHALVETTRYDGPPPLRTYDPPMY
jgi:biotin/methionine sulfoxide reductase